MKVAREVPQMVNAYEAALLSNIHSMEVKHEIESKEFGLKDGLTAVIYRERMGFLLGNSASIQGQHAL